MSGRLNMKHPVLASKNQSQFLIITILSALLISPTSACAQGDDTIAMLRRIGRTFAAIGEKASPAVVVLKVDMPERSEQRNSGRLRRPEPQDNLWIPPSLRSDRPGVIRDDPAVARHLRRLAAARRPQGLGFIVSTEGHILTNHRIVADASRVKAKLADGREFEAEIMGADPAIDVAVLKIDADDLTALELGDTDEVSVGDWVVGITNSMGMGRTFSAGMVTAKGRTRLGMAAIEDFVQTDVILHPGDGGGPLLDLDGKVVGISTAIIGREQGLAISLAIPVNMAKFAYEQIVETGKVERGFLGVAFQDITPELVKTLGLETTEGVLVTDVVPNSAASKAGIVRHDVIAELNGVSIESGSQLLHLVASLIPGEEIEVVVVRDGK
ncbi:MAG TPA: PDZ domain-containing protein, partial [Phycisphaerales bacterium]|nr:PDZ domain-containing protein [Phycisphaerales bacterium]